MPRINWAEFRHDRRVWGVVGLLALVAVAAVGVMLSASADSDRGGVAQPAPSSAVSPQTPPPRPARTASPSPRPPPQHAVFLECYLDADQTRRDPFVVRIAEGTELPDFTEIWEEAPVECYGDSRRGGARRSVEEEAYQASGSDDPEGLLDLYAECGEVDPEGAYATGDFTASQENMAGLEARLILCPDHPQSEAWKAALERGYNDMELEASGRLFYGGTHLVGDEIQPGTYYIEGDIEDCYWERQDSSGNIIDNYFTLGARRVEVTIQPSDYAFLSDGCAGPWRPVGS